MTTAGPGGRTNATNTKNLASTGSPEAYCFDRNANWLKKTLKSMLTIQVGELNTSNRAARQAY